jgi:hypothetical protein
VSEGDASIIFFEILVLLLKGWEAICVFENRTLRLFLYLYISFFYLKDPKGANHIQP